MLDWRRVPHARSIGRRPRTVNQVHSSLTLSSWSPDRPSSVVPTSVARCGAQARLARLPASVGPGHGRSGVRRAKVPDGRVLRVCSGAAGTTISAIGRELGITRQGAGKVVAHLRDHGYVRVTDSAASKREKSVVLTPLGVDYLAHQRATTRAIEDEVRAELGDATLTALGALLGRWMPGRGCSSAPTFVARRASDPGSGWRRRGHISVDEIPSSNR